MSRVVPYSRYLRGVCALVGIPSDEIPTPVAETLNQNFNTAMKGMWNEAYWCTDISPYGEARLVGNLLTYPNNLAQTAYWTATAITPTANAIQNPADGRTTASKLLETTANNVHRVIQTAAIIPDTAYICSIYARPLSRDYVYILFDDGVNNFSAFFNISTGVVGTVSGTGATATIGRQPNGFWLCQLSVTTATTASATGAFGVYVSTDGSTLSYAGNASKGLYLWGVQLDQASQVPQTAGVLPWEQIGETAIDMFFDIFKTNPVATNFPQGQGYEIVPAGAQLINGTFWNYYVNGVNQNTTYGLATANPVWVYYRRTMPNYQGDEFDAAGTYAVDQQMYFVNSIGDGNFYKSIVATTAGQSPDTTPTSWEVLPIYEAFLQYAIYQSYADWLISDGQNDKAGGMYAVAKSKMDSEAEKIERQGGQVLPMKVSTHLTSRAAW